MQNTTPHRGKPTPQNRFLCVVADKHPKFCKKRFPTIEKHNEHLKRCHSPLFWCENCLQKFNSSLSDHDLSLARADHEEKCTKNPTERSKALREKSYLIDANLYERIKSRAWKQTQVSHDLDENQQKETVPQRSWRQIRETIFPSPSPGPSTIVTVPTDEFVPRVEDDRPIFLGQFNVDLRVPTQQDRNTTSPSLFTGTSLLSTILSERTGPLTQPSTVTPSHTGADWEQDPFSFGFGEGTDGTDLDHTCPLVPDLQQDESSSSLTGTGNWDTLSLELFSSIPPADNFEFDLEKYVTLEG